MPASIFDPLNDSQPPHEQDRSNVSIKTLSAQDYVLAFEIPKFSGSIGFLLDLVLAFLELHNYTECRNGKRKNIGTNDMPWSRVKTAWEGPKKGSVYGQADLGRRKGFATRRASKLTNFQAGTGHVDSPVEGCFETLGAL